VYVCVCEYGEVFTRKSKGGYGHNTKVYIYIATSNPSPLKYSTDKQRDFGEQRVTKKKPTPQINPKSTVPEEGGGRGLISQAPPKGILITGGLTPRLGSVPKDAAGAAMGVYGTTGDSSVGEGGTCFESAS
jgi:hypothetical protein